MASETEDVNQWDIILGSLVLADKFSLIEG